MAKVFHGLYVLSYSFNTSGEENYVIGKHAGINGGGRANNRPNMAPKFKKAKKIRELVDDYTAILA